MKTSKYIIGAALIFATAMTSCHDDEQLLGGEGRLYISATLNSDTKVNSRATVEEYSKTCQIFISNAKGVVREYTGIENVPAEGIRLISGHYVAEAFAGDSVPASFDDRFFKGLEQFDITRGNTTNVNLVCKIANTAVSVNYANNIDEILSDYSLTVGHSGGSLTWQGRDTRCGYFMMTPKQKDLEYTITGSKPDGTTYTRKGVIENAKPSTEYILNIKCSDSSEQIGGGFFTIEIEERPIVVNSEVIIALSPDINGYDFDIDQSIVAEQGKAGRRSVMVYGSSALTHVVLSSDVLATKNGIGGSDVDLMGMTDDVKTALANAGINAIYHYDAEAGTSWIKINFEEALLNSLEEDTYTFGIHATDANGKESTATFTLVVSNAPVAANDIVESNVWASHATITGTILRDCTNPVLRYRQSGETAWAVASTNVSDKTMTATLSGLTPGTTYEYSVAADDFSSTEVKRFTTEEALQLPNAGFENWSTNSKGAYLIYGDGQNMFWDSGNHGSMKMNKNVTVPSGDKKHSGNYSIQLNSQFVGVGALGKFAAGNVFVGEYLGTNGTNGILGWGRTFASRPTALKGYIHYTPVAVTSEGTGLSKGDMDQGIIYIAILDGSVTKTYDGKNYPIIVKTKEQEFFSKDDSNVIAYGELIITEATAGSDMVEFTIPLKYVKNDVKAVHIAIVASASRYGDYFVGGSGSTMYLDDLQLVY